MNTWIRGGTILTPNQTIQDGVIVIQDGRVTAIEAQSQVTEHPAETQVIDASGLLVLPGLIDIHVHGGAGSDTMDATPQALETMSGFFLRQGVTAYLATTITNSPEAIQRAIENVASYPAKKPGAQLLGVHLEGPYLSPAKRGAQPLEWIRNPGPDEYQPWLENPAVKLMTLAPELPGTLELIRAGVQKGIRFSAGHSEASYEQFIQAADLGLSQTTHTFNGMPGLHHRKPGILGAALIDERISCEAIADGIHLHPAILQLLVHTKGTERTILVTDAMRATGLEDGEYDLGGQTVHVVNGIARTASGSLAGSTLTLNRAVKNMIDLAGLSPNQAVAMATTTPAAALGLSGQKGSIKPGADADLILVDEAWKVRTALIAGNVIWEDESRRIQ